MNNIPRMTVFEYQYVIEPVTAKHWGIAQKACRIRVPDLKDFIYNNRQLVYADSRSEFLHLLDSMLINVQMAYPEGTDQYALTDDLPEYPKAEYLYDVYQSAARTIPYSYDISSFLSALPDYGTDVIMISRALIWDIKRENERFDSSRCCQILRKFGMDSADIYDRCNEYIRNHGYQPDNVLYIGSREMCNLCASRYRWKTYSDEYNRKPAEIQAVISRFSGINTGQRNRQTDHSAICNDLSDYWNDIESLYDII